MTNPWTTLSSRTVYENGWFRVREDAVIRPDGVEGVYGVVELPESAGVVALDAEDRVAMVSQWRYALGRASLEIPTGSASGTDRDMRAAAARELREETGLTARRWRALGSIDNSNGATTDVAHLFLAEDLEQGSAAPDPEERLEVRWVGFDDAVGMVRSGRITESVSVAAVLTVALARTEG